MPTIPPVYTVSNNVPDDPENIRRNKEYLHHLDMQILHNHYSAIDPNLEIHPRDYNNPDFIAYQENFGFRSPKHPILRFLSGESVLTNPKLRAAQSDKLKRRDDVVLDVEKLRIREIIFWYYYNGKQKLPEMHKPIYNFFWYNLVLLLFMLFFMGRDFYVKKYSRVRKESLKNKLNEANKRSSEISDGKTENRFVFQDPFNF